MGGRGAAAGRVGSDAGGRGSTSKGKQGKAWSYGHRVEPAGEPEERVTMRDPVARLTRKHAGELAPAELCQLRAAAIVRGEGPESGAAYRDASWQAKRAWSEALDVLDRARPVVVHFVDAYRLTALCKTLARLAALRASSIRRGDDFESWEARLLDAEGMADVHAREHAERTAAAAASIAGLRAWARDALSADPLDVLEALSLDGARVDHARGLGSVDPDGIAAWWQYARGVVAEILEEGAPDPAAVEAAAAGWAALAIPG